jgi:hypothetical protein
LQNAPIEQPVLEHDRGRRDPPIFMNEPRRMGMIGDRPRPADGGGLHDFTDSPWYAMALSTPSDVPTQAGWKWSCTTGSRCIGALVGGRWIDICTPT